MRWHVWVKRKKTPSPFFTNSRTLELGDGEIQFQEEHGEKGSFFHFSSTWEAEKCIFIREGWERYGWMDEGFESKFLLSFLKRSETTARKKTFWWISLSTLVLSISGWQCWESMLRTDQEYPKRTENFVLKFDTFSLTTKLWDYKVWSIVLVYGSLDWCLLTRKEEE